MISCQGCIHNREPHYIQNPLTRFSHYIEPNPFNHVDKTSYEPILVDTTRICIRCVHEALRSLMESIDKLSINLSNNSNI